MPAAVPPTEAPLAVTEEPIDWAGEVPFHVCGSHGAVGRFCTGFFSLRGGPSSLFLNPHGQDLRGGNVTLDWVALSPTMESLHLEVRVVEGCPDDCKVNRTIASVQGRSPVSLSIPSRELLDGMGVELAVEPVQIMPMTTVSPGQDVHMVGSVLFIERRTPAFDPDALPA